MGLYTAAQAERYRENLLNPNDAFVSDYFWEMLSEITRKMGNKKFRTFIAQQNQEKTHDQADRILEEMNSSIMDL